MIQKKKNKQKIIKFMSKYYFRKFRRPTTVAPKVEFFVEWVIL